MRLCCPRSINGEEVQLLLKTSDGKLVQLAAAPVTDCESSNNSTSTQRVILKTEPPLKAVKKAEKKSTEASKLSFAKMVNIHIVEPIEKKCLENNFSYINFLSVFFF